MRLKMKKGKHRVEKKEKKNHLRKKVIVAAIIVITICGISSKIGTSLEKNISEEYAKDIYKFAYEGKEINLGEKYDSKILTDEVKYYEVKNGDNNIINKVHTFEKFEIATYSEDGEDKIETIYILSENLETKEGVKIGDSFEKMKEKYGEDFYNNEKTYTYTKEKTSINFIIIDNSIASIEYKYLVD